jgi:hypothetical protein
MRGGAPLLVESSNVRAMSRLALAELDLWRLFSTMTAATDPPATTYPASSSARAK